MPRRNLVLSSFAAAACLLSLFAVSAQAIPVPLTNPSFELGTFVNDGNGTMILPVGSTAITGWTVVADQLAWIISPNPWGLSAQEGNRFLDFTAYPTGAPFGGVTQSIATVVGQQYQLSYYLGSYTARWGGNPVSILATAGGASATCSVSAPTNASTWTQCSMLFTASSANTAITLAGLQGFQYIGLDNVSVETVDTPSVPEPASVVLLGSGLLALVLRRIRTRIS